MYVCMYMRVCVYQNSQQQGNASVMQVKSSGTFYSWRINLSGSHSITLISLFFHVSEEPNADA